MPTCPPTSSTVFKRERATTIVDMATSRFSAFLASVGRAQGRYL
ncbi:MAG TPA: hypothetical protein VL966_12935 [Alphaproteobacteria bacterium]|nr:hypothetical protein [Alphaproteobacteria bacterium]